MVILQPNDIASLLTVVLFHLFLSLSSIFELSYVAGIRPYQISRGPVEDGFIVDYFFIL